MSALRYSAPGRGTRLVLLDVPDPELALSLAQKRVMAALRAEGWSRAAAARRLGRSTTAVQCMVARIAAAGVVVPRGPGRGPDLRPRRGKPELCGHAVSGGSCGRGRGHVGSHHSVPSCERNRLAQSRYDRTGRPARCR